MIGALSQFIRRKRRLSDLEVGLLEICIDLMTPAQRRKALAMVRAKLDMVNAAAKPARAKKGGAA